MLASFSILCYFPKVPLCILCLTLYCYIYYFQLCLLISGLCPIYLVHEPAYRFVILWFESHFCLAICGMLYCLKFSFSLLTLWSMQHLSDPGSYHDNWFGNKWVYFKLLVEKHAVICTVSNLINVWQLYNRTGGRCIAVKMLLHPDKHDLCFYTFVLKCLFSSENVFICVNKSCLIVHW